MKSVGKTIRHIRKMKGMKQSDFTCISQAGIANLESSRSNITLVTLLNILNEIKMPLREFIYIQNDYSQSSTDDIFLDFVNTKNSIDRIQGNQLLENMSAYLANNPNDFIVYCMYVIEDVYLKITEQNSYDIDSPAAKKVWEKMNSIPEWSYYEVFIMSKLFFVFPLDIGAEIVKRIENRMAYYLDYNKDIHFDATFYMNVGKYYIHKNRCDLAKKYLEETIPLCKKYDKPTIENDAYAHLAIIDYLNGNVDAEKEVLDCIDKYKNMRRPEHAKDLESDWNTFFKDKIFS
ncbi:helix-turn-helix transcriptional regulator [Listeria booriae]|uniref:Helix-turn-helix transcriptional regulator n=1 Tax=Listeria booriae TaxID=1552123 RepID=A0A7X1CBI0_9LIST|nr:helix-turn-helix transcriptional regulator [Listeria booriae]MBC1491448.1 helix-turn-helix transcriptional regulator [Listeria booriae]